MAEERPESPTGVRPSASGDSEAPVATAMPTRSWARAARARMSVSGMAAMSRCIVSWSDAWRSAAAGWYMAKPVAARAPVAGSTARAVPWTWLIASPGMNVWRLKRPSVTTSAGSRTSSWRRR